MSFRLNSHNVAFRNLQFIAISTIWTKKSCNKTYEKDITGKNQTESDQSLKPVEIKCYDFQKVKTTEQSLLMSSKGYLQGRLSLGLQLNGCQILVGHTEGSPHPILCGKAQIGEGGSWRIPSRFIFMSPVFPKLWIRLVPMVIKSFWNIKRN